MSPVIGSLIDTVIVVILAILLSLAVTYLWFILKGNDRTDSYKSCSYSPKRNKNQSSRHYQGKKYNSNKR